MCIIAIKSRGVELPSEEILQNMWRANRDGAGFMYAKDGAVHIKKGFMTYESFISEIRKLGSGGEMRNLPLSMHFRITTHGGTKPENTHPFPVTDSIGVLKKLNSTTKLGMAHNGIIDILPREGISDTMEYTASQLAPLSRALPKFYKNVDAMKMISNAIGSSRMAFMDAKGEIYTIGNFVEEGGMRYSNRSFETPKSSRCFPYYYSDDYEAWKNFFEEEEKRKPMPFSKKVMWLNEVAGDFVVDAKGNYMDGDDYAIDVNGCVYAYDYEKDLLVRMYGYKAYNGDGMGLRFNWASPRALIEMVEN